MQLRTLVALSLAFGAGALPAAAGTVEGPAPGTVIEWRAERDGNVSTGSTRLEGSNDQVIRYTRIGANETRGMVPFCTGCEPTWDRYDYIFDRNEYAKLWPLKVGNKVTFQRHRDDRSRSWEHTIEIVGKETLPLQFGSVETFKVVEDVRQLGGSDWRRQNTTWWSPEIGYLVKANQTQSQGEWKNQRFETTGVRMPEGRSLASAAAQGRSAGSANALTGLMVPQSVSANQPYTLTFQYEGSIGPAAERVCFPAGGGQATCWEQFTVNESEKTISTSSRIGAPGTYTVTGFVEYTEAGDTKRSNEVSTVVTVQ